jgi:hypothetical protein
MIAHEWVVRAKCTCGYIWTNPGSSSVVCKCGQTKIENGILTGGDVVTDEVEFKQAVADDIATAVVNLILIHN